MTSRGAGGGDGAVERIGEQLLNWASILDEQTRAQALQAASMPFVRPHLALTSGAA